MQNADAPVDVFDLGAFVASRVTERVRLLAGEVLFFKGEAGHTMYVVLAGRIEVVVLGKLLDRIGRGGIIGEMALIDGSDRCAAALVQEDSELVALDRAHFLELIAEEPRLALAVIDILAQRVRGWARLFPQSPGRPTAA